MHGWSPPRVLAFRHFFTACPAVKRVIADRHIVAFTAIIC
jgi:hypothetical protein